MLLRRRNYFQEAGERKKSWRKPTWGPAWCPGHPDGAASRADVMEALERDCLAAAAPGEGPPRCWARLACPSASGHRVTTTLAKGPVCGWGAGARVGDPTP